MSTIRTTDRAGFLRLRRRTAALCRPFAVAAAGVALVAALLSALPANAQTGSTTYSTQRRTFKVGILLIDSTDLKDGHGDENPDPFVFYIADQRQDLKPQNWEFTNPLSPATVTEDVKSRWDARAGGNNASGYELGQKVSKNMAAYWEVSLSKASINDLLQYDLLFVTNHRTTTFLPADREKLRKLVDAGGIVWIEDCGGMTIGGGYGPSQGSFFLDQVQFEQGGFGNFTTSGPFVAQPKHPILTSPYQLTLQEIANLGDKNYGGYHMATYAGKDPMTGKPLIVEKTPNPETMVTIVGNTAAKDASGVPLPYISAGYYGSGAVILTSGDSGCDVNDYAGGTNVGSGGNSGPICGPNLQTAHAEDLKFLYNVVAWGSANTAYRRNDRRTAASFDTIGAPLLTQFSFGDLFRAGDRLNSKSAPLLSQGLEYSSGIDASGNVSVRCYDTQPFRDYDGDGNYDEGLIDVSLGLPYDEIWRFTGSAAGGGEQPSPPVIATITTNGVAVDEVFVTGPDGTLYSFLATPYNGSSLASGPAANTPVPPSGTTVANFDPVSTHGVAPAPSVYGNVVYQLGPDGMVRAIDPTVSGAGSVLWTSFASSPPYTIKPTATPTIGLSQLTSNTALARNSLQTTNDLMMYVPAEVQVSATDPVSGRLLSYWVGTRNEVQRGFPGNADGASGLMNSRISGGAGTPGAGALNIAPGPPFLVPTVRVYAPTFDAAGNTTVSTQDNYEQGNISPDYSATFAKNAGSDLTGQIQVVKTSANMAIQDPGSGPGKESRIWVALDYDVLYISPLTTPNKPGNYDSATNQIGARNDQNVIIPSYVPSAGAGGVPGGGLDTMTFSPEDLLLFSATQAGATGESAIHAIHEQAGGGTQLKWRFGLHNAGAADGIADGQALQDGAPIFNFLDFSNGGGPISYNDPLQTTATLKTIPEFISGIQVVGPPITTNSGLTYFLARGFSTASSVTNPGGLGQGPVTILMAFQTNPSITLTLPISFDPTAPVQLSQVNALDSSTTVTAQAANADGSAQLRLDASRGKIQIINFNANGGQFSASQSFIVTVTPLNQTTPVRFVVHPLPPIATGSYGSNTGPTGTINPESGGFTPLQWYYVLPGNPMSAATLIGNYLFFTMQPTNGRPSIVAVDADPASNDATVRVGFGEPIRNVVNTLLAAGGASNINHVHWIQDMRDTSGAGAAVTAYAPPVGSQGTLAINTSIGTFAFEDQTTLIADGKRLIEVSPDGSAAWTLDSTQLRETVGGDLPIFGANGQPLNAFSGGGFPTGRSSVISQTLSHPTVARKIGNGDYLIADTGNNRVVRVDRGGSIIWKLDTLDDKFKVLAGGDPVTLSGPTDVQFYITPGANGGYEIHYLVADPGNFRIVEVADYYSSSGVNLNPNKHEVVWVTRTQTVQGQHLSYVGVQRYLGVDPSGTYVGYPYILATVSNSTVAGTSSGGGTDFTGGALVSLNYAPYNTAIPVNTIAGAPSVLTLWKSTATSEPVGNGTVLASANDLRETVAGGSFGAAGSIASTASNPAGFNVRRLAHPTFFTEFNLPNPPGSTPPIRTIYMICDSATAYAVEATTDSTGAAVRDVLWKFTQADYDNMNIVRLGLQGTPAAWSLLPKFTPTSIKLLQNGHFLITNSYYGRCGLFQSGQFNGEVFQVTPHLTPGNTAGGTFTSSNGGFTLYTSTSSMSTAEGGVWDGFCSPRISGASPSFVQKMGPSNNTNLLEQPLFSDRP
jgi:hypothetical protein